VVVTAFNPDYPMIRLATGDLSMLMAGRSPCGRSNVRLAGWMGRADQTTKIKGMFVHPAQVAEVGKRHPELGRLRLVVKRADQQDVMTLLAESASASDGLPGAIREDAAVFDQAARRSCARSSRRVAERRQGELQTNDR